MSSRRVARALLLLGTVVTVFGLSKFHAASIADPAYDFTASFRLPGAFTLVGLLVLTSYAIGLPDRPVTRTEAVLSSLGAAAVSALGVSALQLIVGDLLLPRFVVFGSMILTTLWFTLCALMAGDLDERSKNLERVLVVGDLADVGAVVLDLMDRSERPATLVGVHTLEHMRATSRTRPLVDFGERERVSVLVLDAAAQQDPSIVRQAATLHERGIRVRSLLDFYEEWIGKLPVSELERVSLLFDIAEVHGGSYAPMKRILDLGTGLVMLVPLLLVTPLVWIANLFGNRGPLLFTQERVGKGGETFKILKFRTMRVHSTTATEWTTHGDPRITVVGGLLRRTHLDELPQAINILRGDLAVVGPRPEQTHYVEELTAKLPFYRLRHMVRPGLTGWAQVKYGYASNHNDAMEKLQYEFYYLRHQGLAFDCRILVRTLRSVFGGEGTGR